MPACKINEAVLPITALLAALDSCFTIFPKMLKGNWQESKLQPHHEYNVEAEDWDFEALFVLMNIIHGRNSKVPLGVDIELLSKIAVLVEYYQCYEAADSFLRFG